MLDIVDRAVKGVACGLVATGVEALLTGAEGRLRGRRAVYDPSNLARRLARRYLGIRLSRDGAGLAGQAMRWSYGPSWGVMLAAVMGARRPTRTWPLWGLGLGAAVLGFELVMLPATGATPPVSSWRGRELKTRGAQHDGVRHRGRGLAAGDAARKGAGPPQPMATRIASRRLTARSETETANESRCSR